MSGRSRIEVLNGLLEYNRSLHSIKDDLVNFSFDFNPLITVTNENIIHILMRYIFGKIDEDTVAEWADTIEGRDDLKYEPEYEYITKEIIRDLANPILAGPLTIDGAKVMTSALQRKF